jgi:hypothetical protein
LDQDHVLACYSQLMIQFAPETEITGKLSKAR